MSAHLILSYEDISIMTNATKEHKKPDVNHG